MCPRVLSLLITPNSALVACKHSSALCTPGSDRYMSDNFNNIGKKGCERVETDGALHTRPEIMWTFQELGQYGDEREPLTYNKKHIC